MSNIPTTRGAPQGTDIAIETVLPMIGNASRDDLQTTLGYADAEISKLFEDRNILLTDGGLITFTGTQVQFTENLNITLNQKISGAVPQVISLGSSNQAFANNGDMWVAVLNRTAGTATSSIILNGSALPAANSSNQEVFIIAKRVDAGDGTQRLYFRNGMAVNAGQTVRLGASGSGSGGSGTGSDLGTLQFRAQFLEAFTESGSNSASAVNVNTAFTNAVYSAAKAMYTISYDANKTATAALNSTSVTISVAPAYTVAAGDVIVNLSTGEVKKITAVSSQTAYTIESAFAEALAAQAVCISQALHTKDIYNYSGSGSAISAAFSGATFSEIMVDYEDNQTSGSNLWTPNTTPYMAFSASVDNSNWSSLATRQTLETSTMQSVVCPTSGTSLYIRFFSNASSGSGSSNLIQYEAFMQKNPTAAGTTNVLWSAYCTTNSSTTPINCSVAVTGGKSTITMSSGYTYPVGALSGQTKGSLEVIVNGQVFPRFVSGSVPSTDGYYTEFSASAIQLDKDYSSQQLDVQIIYSMQVLDASSTNTTAITGLQNEMSDGFQSYVSQNANTLAASNAASWSSSLYPGTFYSSITGRASIPDLSQDLKPRFGIERIMTQQLQLLQTEFGPSGQSVWSTPNDTLGQIRFVGSGWYDPNDVDNNRAFSSTVNDYVEITFYGTGLNMLGTNASGAKTIVASIDGGSNGSNLRPTTSNITSSRNTSANVIYPVVSGQTLGIHTVIITMTSGNIDIYGLEILNESSSVKVQPGVGYNSGKKVVTSSQQSFSYSAPVTGTKGGRVLVYQNSDGSIGQAFTAAASSPSYLGSASHSNEEIVRTHHFREFGAGRSDDFSSNTPTSAAFTLDDGTTSLTMVTGAITNTYFQPSDSGTIFFTFVGTGVDMLQQDIASGATTAVHTVYIDGTSVGTLSQTLSTSLRQVTLASGLPYGTHTLQIAKNASGGQNGIGIQKLIVYQPKTPSIPSGAIQIGSYNVMANYVANSAESVLPISTGVLAKANTREFVYTGTWVGPTLSASYYGGFYVSSTVSGSTVSYTFFGTGIEASVQSLSGTATATVSIDGSLYTGAATISGSSGGATTWTPGTSVLSVSTTGNSAIQITGLALGLHTIKFTTTSTNQFTLGGMYVITPVYSVKSNIYADLQNTLPVGSNAISDDRNITPVKNALPATKAWAQAMPVYSTTISSATNSFLPLTDMSVTLKTNAGFVEVKYEVSWYNINATGALCWLAVYMDGVVIPQSSTFNWCPSANAAGTMSVNSCLVPVSPGSHKFDIYFATNTGTIAFSTSTTPAGTIVGRHLTVREL